MRSTTESILAILVLLGIVTFLPLIFITVLQVLAKGLPVVLIGGGIIFLCQMLEGRGD